MKIIELKAYPTSFPVPPEGSVTLGIGRAVKRDAVVVKVTTDDGLVGWGEAHHGRAPGAVAHPVNTTLRQLVLGMAATNEVGAGPRAARSRSSRPTSPRPAACTTASASRRPTRR